MSTSTTVRRKTTVRELVQSMVGQGYSREHAEAAAPVLLAERPFRVTQPAGNGHKATAAKKPPKAAKRSPESRARTAEIRAWAIAQGHKLGRTGRIPAGIVADYEAAH